MCASLRCCRCFDMFHSSFGYCPFVPYVRVSMRVSEVLSMPRYMFHSSLGYCPLVPRVLVSLRV